MTRTADAIDRLRAADPLAADGDASHVRVSASQGRRSPGHESRRRGPRLAISAVAVVAVAAVAFVLLPGGAVAPSDARAVDSLLAAGRAAATAVDTPLQPGQLVYSRTRSAAFTEITLPDGSTVSYVAAPRTSESWIGPDGALTRLETVDGQPWYPTAKDAAKARAAQQAGKGGGTVNVPGVSDRAVVRIPAYAGSVNGPTYDFARTLPTDPVALEQLIRHDTAGAGESSDVEVWVTVQDMLLSPVSPPALRAALYQVAAGLPGVQYLGSATDRLGRTGIAVSLAHGDDGHARASDVMIFDEKTGLLLQTEERALDPTQYGLPASMKGAVVGWTVWEQSGVVDGVGVRPDGTHADLS